jgi:membrane associated rhomboid family serine protease
MFPPTIKGLLIANIAVFLLQHIFGVYSIGQTTLMEFIYRYGALFPFKSDYFYPWQLFSYQFLHGDFYHIFFNMIMLWMFGMELENLWGSRRFFIFYILSGLGAGLVQLFLAPYIGQAGPTVGASGSIYGIFLAFAFSFPDRHIMIFPLFIPIKAKYLIIILVAMDFFMGFSDSSNVAHFAHIGGAVTGWLLMKYGDQIGVYRLFDKLFPPKHQTSGWSQPYSNPYSGMFSQSQQKAKVFKTDWFGKTNKEEAKPTSNSYTSKFHVNGEEIDQTKIDEILDKISVSGYQNLTEREKAILFELSQKIK